MKLSKAQVWSFVHRERARLADDLATLPDEAWTTPSLCPGWDVHDVLAHLVDTAKTSRIGFVRRMLFARFDFDGVALTWILIGYGFVASVLPVWLLLAPRDYLSTFLKIGTIVGLALGIVGRGLGAGDEPHHDPSALVSEHNVIVVAVTYRLGVLGFLGDGSQERPANLGLLDLIAALDWVHENIAAFGGDPDQVTCAGQSAGADAVAHLMTVPRAARRFRRAILQSAPFGIRWNRSDMAREVFARTSHFDA